MATRVLHVLDHSLPLHSGYTFRTRAILTAQAALGLEVRGITGLRHPAQGFVVQIGDPGIQLQAFDLGQNLALDLAVAAVNGTIASYSSTRVPKFWYRARPE